MNISRICCVVACASLAAAQDLPVFLSNTKVVEVTMSATHGDHPVDDLKLEELQLFDNKIEQTISTFEKLGSVAPRAQSSTMIVVDMLNCGEQVAFLEMPVRRALAQAAAAGLFGQLPPGERIAVLALDSKLRLGHASSSDYATLEKGIRSYKPVLPADQEISYLGIERHIDENGKAFFTWNPLRVYMSRCARIERAIQALSVIAGRAATEPGRKNLIWVSGGFPLRVQSLQFGDRIFDAEFSAVARALNTAGIVFYPVSTTGIDVWGQVATAFLADATGGTEYFGTNDVTGMMRSAIEDSHSGYILTYAPNDLAEDGKYHTISLRTARKGVQLRYRQGYQAPGSPAPAGKSK